MDSFKVFIFTMLHRMNVVSGANGDTVLNARLHSIKSQILINVPTFRKAMIAFQDWPHNAMKSIFWMMNKEFFVRSWPNIFSSSKEFFESSKKQPFFITNLMKLR